MFNRCSIDSELDLQFELSTPAGSKTESELRKIAEKGARHVSVKGSQGAKKQRQAAYGYGDPVP